MNVCSAGFRLSFGSRSHSSALVPKVSAALWERMGEAKLGFSGRRVSMGMAFELVVSRNGDGVSAGCAFPKRCANFGNENDNSNPKSRDYAASLNGGHYMDLKVTTPEDDSITYDAAIPDYPSLPPKTVIEAKSGHEWTNVPETSIMPALDERAEQFFKQSAIAARCKLEYYIAVDTYWGAEGLRRHFGELFDVRHRPGPRP